MEKVNYKIDIAVAMVFFNRPNQFSEVFESVRKAAPSKLFLIQDGARDGNEKDQKNILACRKIAETVDWDCEVYKIYSDVNLGCGKRISTGISEAFKYVSKLIILEDDCLPSDSFYPFCKDILEYYENDDRVNMISGMNHLGEFTQTTDDYMFATVGSIAGWATWKRAWDIIDFQMKNFEDANVQRLLKNYSSTLYKKFSEFKQKIDNKEKLTSWSTQRGLACILNSGLIVVPKVNLMSNIGADGEGVHTPPDIRMIPKGKRWLYELKLYSMDFPLKHTNYVIEDVEYTQAVKKKMRSSLFSKLESICLQIRYGNFSGLFHSLKRKLGL